MFKSKGVKNNHLYGYRACLLPLMLHPADWNYSLLHVCIKCDTLVHFNNNVSVFWIQTPCIIIFAFLLKNLLRSMRLRQRFSNLQFSIFYIFQKNQKLNLKLPKIELNCLILLKIENWIENCQKNQFSVFFVIWKTKNWIENCPKSIFIFFKLLKIKQKWNGRFRTRMMRHPCN